MADFHQEWLVVVLSYTAEVLIIIPMSFERQAFYGTIITKDRQVDRKTTVKCKWPPVTVQTSVWAASAIVEGTKNKRLTAILSCKASVYCLVLQLCGKQHAALGKAWTIAPAWLSFRAGLRQRMPWFSTIQFSLPTSEDLGLCWMRGINMRSYIQNGPNIAQHGIIAVWKCKTNVVKAAMFALAL